MIFWLITFIDNIWGGVSARVIVFNSDETVNLKLPEIVKINVETGVGHAIPIVISIIRVETVVPGKFAFWALIDTTFKSLLFFN